MDRTASREAEAPAVPSPSPARQTSRVRRELVGAGTVALATAAISVWVLRVWTVAWDVPLNYLGDANSHHMIVKGLVDGNWYYTNPALGAPFGQEMFDFASADHFHFLMFRLIGIVTGDASVALKLGFLAGFVLIALAAYAALRGLRVSVPFAGAMAILFAFLPFHFWRGTGHLFLSGYFAVPLATLVILWQLRDKPAFLEHDGGTTRWNWRDRRGWAAVGITFLVATTGIYYAVFAGLLLAGSGLVRYLAARDRQAILSSALLLAVLGVVFMAQMAPSLAFRASNGVNEAAVVRTYFDVELYGLKPVQLVLPSRLHRFEPFREVAITADTGPAPSEGGQNLGIVGSVGLAGLVVFGAVEMVRRSPRASDDHTTYRWLAFLAIGAILFSTQAGFAAALSVLGFSEIRAWNRVSVYIAFIALAAVGLFLDRWSRRRHISGPVIGLMVVAIVSFGIWDQTPSIDGSAYEAGSVAWESDEAFVQRIEATLEPGAMVFQLPYLPFPENGPVLQMSDYDLFKGYLHSEDLRWSYGGMKGREVPWQQRVVDSSVDNMLRSITLVGFDGLYIDRYGYADHAASLELEVKRVIGEGPIASDDGRLVFFDLRRYRTGVEGSMSAQEVLAARDSILSSGFPPGLSFDAGFYGFEGPESNPWIWADRKAFVRILNEESEPQRVLFRSEIRTGHAAESQVLVEWRDGEAMFSASSATGSIELELDVPPGGLLVSFTTDGEPADAPSDPRALYLQFTMASVREIAGDQA